MQPVRHNTNWKGKRWNPLKFQYGCSRRDRFYSYKNNKFFQSSEQYPTFAGTLSSSIVDSFSSSIILLLEWQRTDTRLSRVIVLSPTCELSTSREHQKFMSRSQKNLNVPSQSTVQISKKLWNALRSVRTVWWSYKTG